MSDRIRSTMKREIGLAAVSFCIAFLTYGCQAPSIPDPNDPFVKRPNQTDVIENNLHWASAAANRRVLRGEISMDQAQQLVTSYAEQLCKGVDMKHISPADAHLYGDLFLTAHEWKKAQEVLTVAVDQATKTRNVDFQVNYKIRLAQADAELGDVSSAIKLAESTFAVANYQKAPILPGVLLTIVPAAKGKGHDVELANLLLGAIYQHEHTLVDPNTESGKAFLLASPIHIKHAYEEAQALFTASGHPDLAAKAQAQEDKDPQAGGTL